MVTDLEGVRGGRVKQLILVAPVVPELKSEGEHGLIELVGGDEDLEAGEGQGLCGLDPDRAVASHGRVKIFLRVTTSQDGDNVESLRGGE